ncbi:MAG: phospholipase D-like domain-containing protein [Candidatus Helarchaeota archaeon]
MKVNSEKIKKLIKNNKKKIILFFFISSIIFLGIYNSYKPLPKGISMNGKIYNISETDIKFLYDLTYNNSNGEIVYNQTIFDNIIKSIDSAKKYILIDMFLWGEGKKEPYRNVSKEITQHLIQKKKEIPKIEIIVISDDYNTNYNSFKLSYFEDLKNNNISVIFTNGNRLRDSNLIYSPIWRTFFQILGEPKKGWIKTPFYPKKTSIRSFLKLLNFKANHRKIMIADNGNKMYSFIISANPDASSSRHSNVGVIIKENIYKDIYESEQAVLKMSNAEIPKWNFDFVQENNATKKPVQVQLLTENKIKQQIINEITNTKKGEKIKIAMFYLSDRDFIKSLLDASKRGVDIEIILDPSKDAFGMSKHGIPNRPVIEELLKKSDNKIKIKYYNVHKEQFHTKLIIIIKKDKVIIVLGSANYTRRNLEDLNLESDVKIIAPKNSQIVKEVLDYFEMIYTNKDNNHYTIETNSYPKSSLLRKLQYRFQEFTGSGTF